MPSRPTTDSDAMLGFATVTTASEPLAPRMLPERGPFTLRARILSPLDAGGTADHRDGLVEVDERGRITWVGDVAALGGGERNRRLGAAIDLRPWVVLPGMVDLHAHLPQLPNAGLGAGLDLLTWLERYIFPLERRFDDEAAAARLAPAAFRAFAAAGTTTVLAYGAVFKASTDGAFRAAEAHGIRAILGKVMMDRITYDERIDPTTILDRSVRESEELAARWHGADDGRLGYAVTPRFAVSCSAEMLRESASLAARTGAWWQTHVSEDPGEMAEVRRLFPEALDYVDVYDRAGGLGARTILAHGVHLSDREVKRLVETGTRVAHCPSSNLFLASGVMPLARYLDAGLVVGLGSDVAAGPDPSIFSVMRVAAYVQNALRVVRGETLPSLAPLDWLRMGSLEGARALGLERRIGSIEAGKEADLIAVEPRLTSPLRELPYDPSEVDAAEVMSRLIFRAHPDMVRGAWVRGRRLDGPGDVGALPATI
jgi:guanine deaminase